MVDDASAAEPHPPQVGRELAADPGRGGQIFEMSRGHQPQRSDCAVRDADAADRQVAEEYLGIGRFSVELRAARFQSQAQPIARTGKAQLDAVRGPCHLLSHARQRRDHRDGQAREG